jgi:hypothetical protein
VHRQSSLAISMLSARHSKQQPQIGEKRLFVDMHAVHTQASLANHVASTVSS